jgi:cyclophilin family peptidyl-prolyl cis-trans isomerase
MRAVTYSFPALLLGFVILVSHPACAQEAEPATGGNAQEWKTLVAKKAALVAQIEALSEKFADAAAEEKQKLAQQAQVLQQQFQKDVAPRMVQLAPEVFAANPKDMDAAEIMLQVHYSRMQYADAAKVADAILAMEPTHMLALNIGGVANYAEHNFEKSVQQFAKAREEDAIIPQLGGQFAESAADYVQYWEKEQQIRQQESRATGDQQLPQVRMTTDQGEVVLELFENEAPNTVANFISLVEKGYYDQLSFHRIIPNFMAQGGDPNTREGAGGQPGAGGPGYTIKCEAFEPGARRHFAGTLSMAHAGKDTGGSQFFITHLPTPHLDQEIRPESVHTVFGRVVKGLDVVRSLKQGDAIQKAEVIRKRNHEYQPVTQPDAP